MLKESGFTNAPDVIDNVAILLQAVSCVDRDYIVTRTAVDDAEEMQLERVFAYELYYKWKLNLPQNCNLVLNAEIEKKYSKWNDAGNYIIPDMVLHNSQANTDNQMLICEIKRQKGCLNKDLAYDDVMRLINLTYLGNEFKFKLGIFILSGGNEQDLKDILGKNISKIQNLLTCVSQETTDRILCITYDINLDIQVIPIKKLL